MFMYVYLKDLAFEFRFSADIHTRIDEMEKVLCSNYTLHSLRGTEISLDGTLADVDMVWIVLSV